MLNEKDFCDYDTSIALSELGFPLKRMKVKNFIDGQFSDSIVTVLLYEAQKWLREEKRIGITIFHNYYRDTGEMWYQVELYNTKHWLKTFGEFEDWAQALSEGIKEAIKILKEDETIHG